MRRLLLSLLLPLVLLLSACGAPAAQDLAAAPAENAEETPFSVTVRGAVLTPGREADVEALLGKPDAFLSAPSCVHEGTDVLYTYADAEVAAARSKDGKETVTSVALLSGAAATAEGVKLGDPVSAVTDAYGACEPKLGRYVYARGGTTLTFTAENGVVTAILYASGS